MTQVIVENYQVEKRKPDWKQAVPIGFFRALAELNSLRHSDETILG